MHTVDINVMVLTIGMSDQFSPDELWIAFGTGLNFHYTPVHEGATAMDAKFCATLHVSMHLQGEYHIFIWG